MASLLLASASPRRKQLLEEMGHDVVARPVIIDETNLPGESPQDYIFRIVRNKMFAALGIGHEAAASVQDLTLLNPFRLPVLVADTIVCCDGDVLQKPRDEHDARRMLQTLSGRSHEVITRFALSRREFWHEQSVSTQVVFRTISLLEIDDYVRTGEGRDKAGSYAIQGGAAKFVRKIDGSYGAVVGLPQCEVSEALARAFGQSQ